MSENLSSHDPVVEALQLEKEVADVLNSTAPDTKVRQEVRKKLEGWMTLVDAKTAKKYKEELGGINPEQAKAEMLTAIHARFPQVAKELGWHEGIDAQFQQAA